MSWIGWSRITTRVSVNSRCQCGIVSHQEKIGSAKKDGCLLWLNTQKRCWIAREISRRVLWRSAFLRCASGAFGKKPTDTDHVRWTGVEMLSIRFLGSFNDGMTVLVRVNRLVLDVFVVGCGYWSFLGSYNRGGVHSFWRESGLWKPSAKIHEQREAKERLVRGGENCWTRWKATDIKEINEAREKSGKSNFLKDVRCNVLVWWSCSLSLSLFLRLWTFC